MSSLKDCPFCGAPASQDESGFTFCSVNCVWVDCGAERWNRRSPSPAVKALVEAAREWREADDQLRGPMGSAAPQTALNRLASRTGKLREALAAVEREIEERP